MPPDNAAVAATPPPAVESTNTPASTPPPPAERLSAGEQLARGLTEKVKGQEGAAPAAKTEGQKRDTTPSASGEAPGKAAPVTAAATTDGGSSKTVERPVEAPSAAGKEGIAPQTEQQQPPPDADSRAREAERRSRALELENARLLEAQRQAQFTATEQNLIDRFETSRTPTRQVMQDIWSEMDEAKAEEDYPRYNRLVARYNTLYEQEERATQEFGQQLAGHRQQAGNWRARQHVGTLERKLAELEIEPADLAAIKKGVNPGDFYDVLETTVKAAQQKVKTKYEAEIKTLKEKLAGLEQEYRQKWEDRSPGAQPPVIGSGASPADGRPKLGQGQANDLLAWGLSQKKNK
jgi:hypothetical protein